MISIRVRIIYNKRSTKKTDEIKQQSAAEIESEAELKFVAKQFQKAEEDRIAAEEEARAKAEKEAQQQESTEPQKEEATEPTPPPPELTEEEKQKKIR